MKKKLIIAGLSALVPVVAVWAVVTITAQPTSLVTSPMLAPANSEPIGLFKLSIGADASETLTSITVTVANSGSSTATGADFDSLLVYRDDGDNVFDLPGDLLAGSQSSVNVGSATTIATSSNNSLPATFFVALSTGASWSDSAPADSVTVSLAANGVVTSANSPTVTAASTSTITADTTGPSLISVMAADTGLAPGLNAGDSVVFTFSEATNKPTFTAAELASTFTLSSGHTWLDGLGIFVSQSWNAAGTQFSLVLSGNVTVPTVAVGDIVTLAGALIKDAVGNSAAGSVVVSGTFGGAADTTGPVLISALAANTGLAAGLNAGDTIVFTFNEPTTKPVINAANVNSTLMLNNSHSYLDGSGAIGTAVWNSAGTQLTISLTTNSGIPSVVVGDTITVAGAVIKDAAGNNATGSVSLGGSFGSGSTNNDGQVIGRGRVCDNGLIRGQRYIIEGSNVLYKVVNCKLKATKKTIITLPANHGFEIVASSDRRAKDCDHRRDDDDDDD